MFTNDVHLLRRCDIKVMCAAAHSLTGSRCDELTGTLVATRFVPMMHLHHAGKQCPIRVANRLSDLEHDLDLVND